MITKTTASPFKKSGGDIVPLDTAAKVGIGLSSPVGMLDVDTGSGGFCVTEVTLADDASVAVETIVPASNGFLWISDCSATPAVLGLMVLQGNNNTVVEQYDPYGKLSTSGTTPDGFLGVNSDGDNTYTMTNKLGSEKTFVLSYLGED